MPMVLHFLVSLVKKFNARYPHIQLSLMLSENYINLIERKVDIAFKAGELDDSSLRVRLICSPKVGLNHQN